MRAPVRRAAVVRTVALGASAIVLGCVSFIIPATTAGATPAPIDTSSQASVLAAYKSIYVPAMKDTIDWTGSVAGCNAGTTSSQSQQLSLDAINFDRSLAGLDPVTLDPALNADAQQGALIMSANSNLSHDVPSTWKCYTKQGHDAAASSDLYLGVAGAQAIGGYMVDPGSSNSEAGHRRWILYPPARTMGTGSTNNSNDLYIFGDWATSGYANPSWVSWPTAGYFPSPLEPDGRWSLSGAAGHSYNFGKAKVSVKTSSGKALHVSVSKPAYGYGADTLVWQVTGVSTPTGTTASSYSVSVTGIVTGGKTVSHSYTVKLFNPDSLELVSGSSVSGFTRVGQVLTAGSPQFTPAASSLTYRWYRDGKSISGATHATRTLTSSDRGHTLTVHVEGHRSAYASLVSTSAATAVVTSAITPSASVAPAISGTARVGSVISADPGQWNPNDHSISYHWYRSGTSISGATAAQYTITSKDHGHRVWCRVTVGAAGYSTTSVLKKTGIVRSALG